MTRTLRLRNVVELAREIRMLYTYALFVYTYAWHTHMYTYALFMYTYAVYICLVCMHGMYAFHVLLRYIGCICMPYMYALCLVCMPYMHALEIRVDKGVCDREREREHGMSMTEKSRA